MPARAGSSEWGDCMERNKLFQRAGITAALALATLSGNAAADPCLTNASDTVGNAVFGATVQTFINAGINPATTCIENGLWSDPAHFTLGSYVGGAEGFGTATDPTVLGAYNTAGSLAANANARDFAWVQDVSGNENLNGITGDGPANGIIWDLQGQANQVAIFVFVDHGPVPQEVLENTAWLSNDATAANAGWTQAQLTHVYGAGWSPDPNIADGFVAVYQLPTAATFRYVSVTWGGPGAIQRDGDNEIDAVAGLDVAGGGVGGGGGPLPEPASALLLGLGLLAAAGMRRRR